MIVVRPHGVECVCDSIALSSYTASVQARVCDALTIDSIAVCAFAHTQRRTDGSIWFTDPDYGLRAGRHVTAYREKPLQKANHVFRVQPGPDTKLSAKVEAMTAALHRPNGLCFSPDETLLYVADSGGLWGPTFDKDGAHHVMVFDVLEDGKK